MSALDRVQTCLKAVPYRCTEHKTVQKKTAQTLQIHTLQHRYTFVSPTGLIKVLNRELFSALQSDVWEAKMDIKKGVSYIAFGYLLTLVNLNLNFGSFSVNVFPNFIGWILFFLAFDKLGPYASDKPFLKWTSLILVILAGTTWILGIAKPELDADLLTTIMGVISVVYLFILFGVLEQIAGDYHSSRASTIHMLKILNPILYVAFVVSSLGFISSNLSPTLGGLAAVIGIAALVTAIVTLVVLFQLRKEINSQPTMLDNQQF